jgi:predicted nucleic acid-binding protein
MTTYQDVRRQVENLTPDEQLRLLKELAVMVRRPMLVKPKHSIMELEGLGKEIWNGLDAQEYVNQERSLMEWLMQLQGQVVGLDTAPLIYLIEQNQVYLGLCSCLFWRSRGEFQVVTSTLTLTEVLVHPLRSGNVELACQYRDILLDQENLITVPISVEIAEVAAQLRARQNLRTPDAIQIATAMGEGATFFLTNDARLAAVPDLKVLVLDAL